MVIEREEGELRRRKSLACALAARARGGEYGACLVCAREFCAPIAHDETNQPCDYCGVNSVVGRDVLIFLWSL